MTWINIQDLIHHFSKHLKASKAGERADSPGWKRKIKKIEIKGEPLSETIVRNRRE